MSAGGVPWTDEAAETTFAHTFDHTFEPTPTDRMRTTS